MIMRVVPVLLVGLGFLYPHNQLRIAAPRQDQKLPAVVASLPEPSQRFALIIGVEAYEPESGFTVLEGPNNDADEIGKALQKFAGFPKENIVILASNKDRAFQPTRTNILMELTRMRSRVPQEGLLLFAFSGHGIERQGQTFLLPQNARMYGDDTVLLEETAITISALKRTLSAKPIQQVLMFLDSCRDDPEQAKGTGDNPLSPETVKHLKFDDLNKEIKAFAVIYATEVGKRSYVMVNKKEGYFSSALVEALSGKASNTNGVVTLESLLRYLEDTVPARVQRDKGNSIIQKPWATVEGYRASELVLAASPTPFETSDLSQYVVKLNIGIKVDEVAKKLRDRELRVVVLDDDDGRFANKTDYTVMWVGTSVPPAVASSIIRIAKQEMPWLKYIFIQYQSHEWDTQMFLNAHTDWVRRLGLKPLTDSDFTKLMAPGSPALCRQIGRASCRERV